MNDGRRRLAAHAIAIAVVMVACGSSDRDQVPKPRTGEAAAMGDMAGHKH